MAEVRAKGAAAWLDEQLRPELIDDSVCDAYLTRYPTLNMSPAQLHANYAWFSWTPMMELGQSIIARALFSKRQLFEVMVEFWTNHFHVMIPGTAELWDVKTAQDRDIRKYALGRFADLLAANSKCPAMMRYLDNDANGTTTPNENYGRELLELHTVGIAAGYTQAEVVDSSRLMTGFAITDEGTFAYEPSRHFVGPVRVLGFSSANASAADGLKVAEAYLDYLARHPSTARQLMTKLTRRFVSDSPSGALISRLAQVYLDNDTAIVPVLRALFSDQEFLSSFGQKTRRPVEDILGGMRAMGVEPAPGGSECLTSIYWCLNAIGQLPMNWTTPQGFPDTTSAWLSTAGLLNRWNTHLAVAQGWFGDGYSTPSPPSLVGGATPASNGDLVDLMCLRFLGVRLPAGARSALVSFLDDSGTPAVRDAINFRLDILATLIFNSPQWMQR